MSPSFYILEPNPGESSMSYMARVKSLASRLADKLIAKNVRPEPAKGYTVITDGPVSESEIRLFGLRPEP